MNVRGPISRLGWLGILVFAGCSGNGGPGNVDASQGADASAMAAPDLRVVADTGAVATPDVGQMADVAGQPEPDVAGAYDEAGTPDLRADIGEKPGPDLGAAADGGGTTGSDVVADTGAAAWPSDKYISVDEVYALVQAGTTDMLLVNVVDEEFYNLGFIAGSLKIPWDTLEGRLAELDRARHIVLYCRKGVRSESAYTTLKDNGYTLVWAMEGGIERWIDAGYPVVPE
jgi:rhodanese-related sulfurtransferase